MFLTGMICVGSAFDKYDYRLVPFSEFLLDDFEAGDVEQFSLDLASIALSPGLPDSRKAKLLAAARRVSPLNKVVFLAEYNLSIGEKPLGLSGVSADQINTSLKPYIEILNGKSGSPEFLEYISEAISGESFAASNRSTTTAFGLGLYQLCKINAKFYPVPGSDFEFSPGTMDSKTYRSAFRESLKFLALTDHTKLSGWRVEFSAEPSVISGKGAALPCAVLTKAFLDKIELDPLTAYIGDVNADGTVQPEGYVRLKLQGQRESLPPITIIPQGDVDSLSDLLILNHSKIFVVSQIISVRTLDEAIDHGKVNRTPDFAEALTLFSEVQKVLIAPEGGKFIRNSHINKRLDRVVELEPDHVSAKYLKMVSDNRYPRYLSLAYTMVSARKAVEGILKNEDPRADRKGRQVVISITDSVADLKRYRSRTNPALLKLVDAVIAYASGSKRLGSDKTRLIQNVSDQWDAVQRNIQIQEKLK